MTHDRVHLAAADAGPPTNGVSGERSIRVVLADNHTSMRRSLRFVLESEGGMAVIADASDLATAIRHVYRHRPHVLVLDPWLLDESRVEAVRHLREQAPSTEIVVATMHDSATLAKQALEAGAIAFVLKDTADSELPEAVRRAARGERYTSPRVTARPAGLNLGPRQGNRQAAFSCIHRDTFRQATHDDLTRPAGPSRGHVALVQRKDR
jgi:DNA-binding NarL/FixJ family response regulator